MSNTDQKINTNYTLILGAEGELGKALAREVAKKKCNLILVSTTSIDLQRFSIWLQLKEDVQVEAMKIDLSDREALHSLTEKFLNKYEIRALINNITCDWSVPHGKYISEIAQEDFLTRFRGAALITIGLLPRMKKLSASYIQHIIPFPFNKEYSTADMQQSVSKMYVFAKELEEGLKEASVTVSMVHPASMKKNTDVEMFEGLAVEANTMSTQLVATKAVNGMLQGDRLIIPGFRNKIQFFLNRHAASWMKSEEASLDSSMQLSL